VNPSSYLKVAHYLAGVDGPAAAEKVVQLPIGHVLGQVVDDQIGGTGAVHLLLLLLLHAAAAAAADDEPGSLVLVVVAVDVAV